MKNISMACLFIVLTFALTSRPLLARGGGGHGGGGGFAGGHGGGFRGGHYGGGSGHGGGYGYGRGVYGIGIGLGLGYGMGYYGGYPYYGGYGYGYPSTIVQVPVTPPVYIQQSPPVVQQYSSGYWYYCSNPEGYYPYIKQCPIGWQPVSSTPSPHP